MALVNMNFGTGTVINKYWTDFKTVVSSKSLSIQYEQDSNQYIIYAVDNNIVYTSLIYKGTVPDPSNYSQVTNDADKTDFTTNFQSAAGTKTQLSSNVTVTSALPAGSNVIGGVTQSGTWNVGSITTLPAITGTVTANIGTTNGLALDATVSTMSGKLPASVGQKAMSASLPVVLASDQSSIPVTGSGSFTVAQATASNLNATIVGGNTAGTPSSSVITIQGNASGIAVPVSGTMTVTGVATSANQTNGTQLTAIGNGTNTVAIKAASTAAVVADPSLVVQISPNQASIPVTLSQTDRTNTGTITTTQSVAINSQGCAVVTVLLTGTWTGTVVFEGTIDNTNWNALNGIVPTTGVIASSATGNGNWEIESGGYQQVRIRGNSVATGSLTVALDAATGIQSVNLSAPLPTGSNTIGAVTGSGNFTVVQATAGNLNATVTGTVTSNIGTTNGLALDTTLSTLSGKFGSLGQKTMAGSAPVVISSDQSAIPVSGTVTANVGTTNGLALDATLTGGTQRSKITDGTNNAAVKAASTAAIATDPALVVAISPNNTVGVTGTVTSNIGTTNGLALDATLTGGTQTSRITDGTNTATVKAASTAAIAADKAIVVAISPNNTVAATQSGTWNIGSITTLPSIPTGANVIGGVTQSGTWNVGLSTGANTIGIVNQGTAATLANAWSFKITDATNGPAAVKAASTAAIATDPALVVAISPNNTVAVTSATLATNATLTGGTQLTQIGNGTTTAAIKAASTAAVAADPALVVAISPNNTIPVSMSNTDTLATGSITNTQSVAVNSQGRSTVGMALTGTWTGTVVFEKSIDGTNWVSAYVAIPGTGSVVTSATANGTFEFGSAGYQQFRVRGSTVASGSLTVSLNSSTGVGDVAITSPLPTGSNTIGAVTGSGSFTVAQATAGNLNATVVGTVTSNIGTTNGLALDTTLSTLSGKFGSLGQKTMAGSAPVVIASDQGAITVAQSTAGNLLATVSQGGTWSNRITDGTNTAAVKAASTAATTTDPALVVTMSPNAYPILTQYQELATFTCIAANISPGNNKSMFSIYNAGTKIVRIADLFLANVQTSSSTGIAGLFAVHKMTTLHTTGTGSDITSNVVSMDSSDTLDGGITIKTGATVAGVSANYVKRTLLNTSNWSQTSNFTSQNHSFEVYFPLMQKPDALSKSLYLRANEGLTLTFENNSTSGSFDIHMIFTQQ